MAVEEGSGYCRDCGRNVLVRRTTPNHVLHLLVTLFLCGLWLPVWALIAVFGGGSWRCTQCGSTRV
jgi:hypothetical protein